MIRFRIFIRARICVSLLILFPATFITFK